MSNLIHHRFKPGQSGNPGGRPKKDAISSYLRNQLELHIPESMKSEMPRAFSDLYGESATFGEMLAFKLIDRAAKGNLVALSLVLDRVEGKVTQKMAVDAEPVVFRLVHCDL